MVLIGWYILLARSKMLFGTLMALFLLQRERAIRVYPKRTEKGITMIFAYTRVSTTDQNAERQHRAIEAYAADCGFQIDRFYEDQASGKDFSRPKYQALKESLRAGDLVIFKELDRMGRNMQQIKAEWHDLQQMGVEIIITDTPILNTSQKSDLEKTLISNIVFELLAYMAEKERSKIRARQAEGIAIARHQGKYKGRKPLAPENYDAVIKSWRQGDLTATEAMARLHMSKSTFYRRVRQW